MLKFLSPVHKAVRQIGVWFESQMVGMSVAPQEGHLLSYLRSYSPCPIAELVRVFGQKHSTMTSMLDRLEEQGLIERKVNPDDRRSFLVSLTRKGKAEAKEIQKLVVKIESEIGKRVSKSELAGFNATMKAIEDATQVVLRQR